MKKTMSAVAATVLTCAVVPLGLGFVTATASATPTHVAAVSNQDAVWMKANAQTDLAEIAIGKIALTRARYSDTRMMASVTIAQHTVALKDLEKLAKTFSVNLPGAPSASQKAQAAQLATIKLASFDKMYDGIQVAGHLISIAQTTVEIVTGKDSAVISFAQYYLPIAEQHLNMALKDLTKLEGK